jgi:hypothetical protein
MASWSFSHGLKSTRDYDKLRGLIGEEIEDIAEHAGWCAVDFGVVALGAGYGGEAFGLDVEDFAEESAGRAEFTDIVLRVFAFGTGVIEVLHNVTS